MEIISLPAAPPGGVLTRGRRWQLWGRGSGVCVFHPDELPPRGEKTGSGEEVFCSSSVISSTK